MLHVRKNNTDTERSRKLVVIRIVEKHNAQRSSGDDLINIKSDALTGHETEVILILFTTKVTNKFFLLFADLTVLQKGLRLPIYENFASL